MAEQELAQAEEIDSDYSHRGNDIDAAAQAWSQHMAPEDEDNQGDDLESQDSEEEVEEEETNEDLDEVESDVQMYKVRADGVELDIPLDELISGYSRQSSFTKKSQALSEQRKAFETEMSETRNVRAQALQVLESAQKSQPQQPQLSAQDWQDLKDDDPMQYLVARDQLREEQMQNQQREQQINQLRSQEEADQEAQLQNYVGEQRNALLELVPEWNDAEVADREKQLVMLYGERVGFTPEELANAYDSRSVATMRKAALYDQLVEKRKGIKPVSRQSMSGGSASVNPSSSKSRKASQRLSKSGSIDDAAAVFKNMFN